MFKILKKLKLNEKVDKGQVIISRQKNKINIHNVDTDAHIAFNATSSQVTLTFTVRDGDVVVIGESDGFIEKRTIEDKRL